MKFTDNFKFSPQQDRIHRKANKEALGEEVTGREEESGPAVGGRIGLVGLLPLSNSVCQNILRKSRKYLRKTQGQGHLLQKSPNSTHTPKMK